MKIHEMDAGLQAPGYMAERRTGQRRERIFYLIGKRLLDIVCSIAGLILISPVLLTVAIWIKLEDPRGKVLFSQQRVGKDGRSFKMYKFRSMVSNAEEQLQSLLAQNEVSGAMFKMKDDPRVTRVGRFIRRTSIDELPQLLNVIRGDMSLVGPRPPLVREVQAYTPHDWQRMAVTPGCTGLWQISGRNSIGFAEMVELDLRYISRRSLAFDIWILFRTVLTVLGSKHAY